ncbi:hypothetical protein MON38_19620 [Hymenobacter sp. DH14]|uniref:Uncharacterized protein n=1 Tax=Hymenobacter cyanobacteriorum TaxID=2926463 RepID=A0A9X2AI65_9BACT|nr:hypothetical protein [Hymenobacter cyanobacteriorum]MCI1189638.1 hypothetical protein [Hymenobacter cyanobacteriorum]
MSASKSFQWQLPVLVVLCSALAFGNCKLNNTPPPPDTIYFGADEGISYRTDQNVANGPQDPTDWTLDATWNSTEQSLFASLGIDLNGASQGTATNISAYPNPATAATTFRYDTPDAVSCQGIAVGNTYQSYYMRTFSTPARNLVLPLDLSAFPKGQRYRLYYVLYNGSKLYYKGHGDFRVN